MRFYSITFFNEDPKKSLHAYIDRDESSTWPITLRILSSDSKHDNSIVIFTTEESLLSLFTDMKNYFQEAEKCTSDGKDGKE